MTWLVAPHNDHRTDDPGQPAGSVTVVIPVYQRTELLERTLAGMVAQTVHTPVVVADDGSTEDVAGVAGRFADRLDVRVVRQERHEYGAGRARNLGAAHATGEVVVFIDADCLPAPDLVERHLARHTHHNLVVIGGRRHIRSEGLALDRLAAGEVDLSSRLEPDAPEEGPSDFRRVLYRRTSGLTSGNEAYRSLVSSNFSVRRTLFEEVGGFATDFTRWGGEDTELGWRLQNAGAFFLPADDALVYHQTDLEGPEGWRAGQRRLNEGLIGSKIPHRFYRRPTDTGIINQTPKWSVVVWPAPAVDLDALVVDLLDQTLPDLEIIVAADPADHEPVAGSLSGDPRVRFVSPGPDPLADPLLVTRGELVLLLHGAAVPDRRLLARVARRMDERPRISSLTVGYRVFHGPRYTDHPGVSDTALVDRGWGSPIPLAAVARRRDWARTLRAGMGAAEAWETILSWDLTDHLRQPLISLPGPVATERPAGFRAVTDDLRVLFKDLRSAEPKRAVGIAARYAHGKLTGRLYRPAVEPAPRPPAEDGPAHVRYVGWTGKDNLGDEAMLEAVRRLMPWAEVSTAGDPRHLLMLGGGTLINRTTYLRWLQERDSPRVERAVFGTGVADPEFWGITEPIEGWVDFLTSCAYVGVRGPRSVRVLRSWGYQGPLEAVGDPALALEPAHPAERQPGRVVVAPVWTRGELWGGTDGAVFQELAEAVGRMSVEGRDVHLLTCHPDDDRPAIEIMRGAGRPDLSYHAGYLDLDATLRLLGSADVVVAERLHAAVLAAAVGTPFVALEYRPKLRDFAASVGAERWVIRTDALDAAGVVKAVDEVAAGEQSEVMAGHVATYRRRLRAAADTVREAVGR